MRGIRNATTTAAPVPRSRSLASERLHDLLREGLEQSVVAALDHVLVGDVRVREHHEIDFVLVDQLHELLLVVDRNTAGIPLAGQLRRILAALDIGNLSGSSVTYAFGPTMRWTLFSGGRIRNNIKIEEARTEQFLSSYEQTILLALEDTEGAMVAFAQERDRQVSVGAARGAAAQSVSLVKDLYRSGLTQFQNVLDMERSLAQRDDELALSRGALAGNAVRIYRALGGGWDPEDPEPWLALQTASTE